MWCILFCLFCCVSLRQAEFVRRACRWSGKDCIHGFHAKTNNHAICFAETLLAWTISIAVAGFRKIRTLGAEDSNSLTHGVTARLNKIHLVSAWYIAYH